MLNKKGSSFVDIIVGLILLSTTLLMMYQFLTYLKINKDIQNTSMIGVQLIHNEVERAYRDIDWATINGQTFETPKGEASSTFTEYYITEHSTEHLKLDVTLNDFQESVSIERSVHWNE